MAKAKAKPALRAPWKCPRCGRAFTRQSQRHACGTGNKAEVLRNRPENVVRLYDALESFAKSLGPIEIVARDRYVLLRTTRIFADVVIMSDAVRVAIHLQRRVKDPLFIKVVSDGRKVTHVAKLQDQRALRTIEPYLEEAHALSVAPPSKSVAPQAKV